MCNAANELSKISLLINGTKKCLISFLIVLWFSELLPYDFKVTLNSKHLIKTFFDSVYILIE